MKLFLSHRRTSLVLKAILIVGAAGALWERQWLTAAATIGILLITFTPLLLAHRFRVVIPAEFELLAITFVFASLFLGEVSGFYTRFWWWDIVLHTASGFLLGIIGFLLVHVLNEIEEVGLHMKPGFVAFFAFLFALGVGTLWEIFEFGMDSLFGLNMQKPMFGDASGLTDTMWDLIVDAIGALTIAILGYIYLKTARRRSFLQRWIVSFIRHNPRLFRRQAHPRTRRN
ncbi:MAG TPA: hypothetical protein VK971_13840 [Thiohalobacter sp.]|nr:hypothetical protein [Thiohalobacter sp.]